MDEKQVRFDQRPDLKGTETKSRGTKVPCDIKLRSTTRFEGY